MSRPIQLEILSLIPITYKQCTHCEAFYDQSGIGHQVHDRILAEYPQDLLEDHNRLTTLMIELINRFQDDIIVKVIDPQSIQGILKSLRYRVREYQTFIINNQDIIVGWNRAALDHALESCSLK
jgi:hypothetical protein